MNASAKYLITLFIGTLLIIISGCATQPPIAKFKHPLFDEMGINTVAIMPILDRRKEKNDMDLDDNIFPEIKSELDDKGYGFTLIENKTLIENFSLYDFLPEYQPLVKSLELNNAQWVMFIVVEKAFSEFEGIGYHGHAHLSGYVYNKNTGEKVWEGIGKGSAVYGVLLAALSDDDALENAANHLAQQFPVNGK